LNGSVSNGTLNRRLSISGQQNGGGHGRSGGKDSKKDTAKIASPGNNAAAAAPVGVAATAKEDTASQVSVTDPVPSTP